MGRWPGSNLYFKAKVVLIRDEDNEYDVEFSNGTVFTLKAKDVYKDMPKRGRSKSRGREARAPRTIEIESASEEEVAAAPVEEAPAAVAEEAAAAPIEEAAVAVEEAAASVDEGASVKPSLAPNPELPDAHGYKKKKNWHLADMLMAIIFMVGTPTVLVALHTVCGPKSCTINYEAPKLSTDYKSYLDIEALKLVLAFSAVLVSINFLPIGKKSHSVEWGGSSHEWILDSHSWLDFRGSDG